MSGAKACWFERTGPILHGAIQGARIDERSMLPTGPENDVGRQVVSTKYFVLSTRYALVGTLSMLAFVACTWSFLTVRGDIFVLESGGQIEGEWLNRQEQPLTKYQIRRGGVTLTLRLDQVRETIRQSPDELDYERRAAATADTVEAQWDLAEWCRKKGLGRQRDVNLRRIVELDPNHQQARFALGYQFLKGEWVLRSDARRQEGYEFYRGKWRTPQEIEILENRSRNELAEKEWQSRLRRWRRDLDDREKHRLALQSLTAVKDPVAVRPIGEFFASERVRSVKTLYADILATIQTREAIGVLVKQSLVDQDEEIFFYCIDKLVQLKQPHISDAFVAALKDNSNAKVNRAASALARLQDKSSIAPLIEALITTHTTVIDNGEYTTAGFGNGVAGLQKGDGRQTLVFHIQNQPALDALSKLTGADFGFDKQAWRTWFAQEKIAQEAGQPAVNVRRQ